LIRRTARDINAAMTRPLTPDRLIISIHIPKTAGTAFADVLTQNFGDAVGFYYGPKHKKTHPLLRGLGAPATADDIARAEDAGIRIIHGHFHARRFRLVKPDPSDYWVWLRDPAERIISEFFFHKGRRDVKNPVAVAVRNGALSLAEFAKEKQIKNLQSRLIEPFTIDEIGFVGLTELYDDCIELSGLTPAPPETRVRNTTRDKPEVAAKERNAIARANFADVVLHADALRRIGRERRGIKRPS